MPDPQSILIFLVAGITLNLTPGPDMLYVASRSLGQGRNAGLASAFGVAAGSLVHASVAAFGLSALFAYSETAFLTVKYAGVVYLVYLGIKTLLSGKNALAVHGTSNGHSLSWVFLQGALTNILNPKVALFFLSFLPQFVDPANGSVIAQTLFLGLLFNTTGTAVNAAVALLCGRAASWLQRSPSFWRWQRWFTGSVLLALGLRLALVERR